MRTQTELLATNRKVRRIALLAAVFLGSTGVVAAKDNQPARQPANANQYYGLYQGTPDGLAVSRWDRARFDHSGTRGREGLGEDPLHPEGPGNVAD
jgi:hypothetical protein